MPMTPLSGTSPLNGLLLFGLAIALLLGGHIVRLARWTMLMRQIGPPRLGEGFMALSLAYLINAIVPLRLGEIARGVYYARRLHTDAAFVLASIIVERTLDLVAVWAITMVLLMTGVFGAVPVWTETLLTVGTAVVIFAMGVATSRSARFRRGAWLAASVFNPGIRLVVLDTLWSLLEVFREGRARWPRILAQSIVMWALYVASFAVLAQAIGLGLQEVFRATVSTPLMPMIVPLIQHGGESAMMLLVYSFAPFLLFLAYVGAKQQFGVSVWGAVSWMHNPRLFLDTSPRSKTRFVEAEHYSDFLARRFNGTDDLVSDFEGNALRDIVVQRMLRGGSDALTVMVQLRDQLCIRKYAAGGAADKLEAQCNWLTRHSNILPTVRIMEQARTDRRFFYDMEYSRTSRDLFDVVHTYDIESSWRILSDVMATMAGFHQRTAAGEADDACIGRYAADKVTGNLRAIKAAAPAFFEQERVNVNGVSIDLSVLDRFAASGFVTDRIRHRGVATIHGDLTIENILTDPERPAGWFLIDPNSGNVFESPMLDYAKLLQSLHLGYESLNRDLSCSFDGHLLAFPNARSAQYATLYDRTTVWLRDRFGEDGLREIRLHEIVHYFRLTPYKFRKGAQPGMVFLGCLCLLTQQYFDDYESPSGAAQQAQPMVAGHA